MFTYCSKQIFTGSISYIRHEILVFLSKSKQHLGRISFGSFWGLFAIFFFFFALYLFCRILKMFKHTERKQENCLKIQTKFASHKFGPLQVSRGHSSKHSCIFCFHFINSFLSFSLMFSTSFALESGPKNFRLRQI